jgi:chromosome segregation ATPase
MIAPNLNAPPPVSESAIAAALTLLSIVSNADGCQARIADLTKQEAAVRDAIAQHENAARAAGATHREAFEKLEAPEKKEQEIARLQSELSNRQEQLDLATSAQEEKANKLAEREATLEKRERAFKQKIAEFRANLGV